MSLLWLLLILRICVEDVIATMYGTLFEANEVHLQMLPVLRMRLLSQLKRTNKHRITKH